MYRFSYLQGMSDYQKVMCIKVYGKNKKHILVYSNGYIWLYKYSSAGY